jgi:molybdopterin-guanine dinucleotide biosynthesis adapter protein
VKSLHIVGRKKSGKTSLLVRLLPLLRARGLRVGTVKHSAHPHSLDREGSDSWRHREAGAEVTIGITAAAVSIHLPLPGDSAALEALIARETGGLELMLIEGWSERPGPKIEVLPADEHGLPKPARHGATGELLAVVGGPDVRRAPEPDPSRPWFRWEDAEALADFVARWTRDAPPVRER